MTDDIESIADALPPHPILVMLVDDQPVIAETVRRMLADEGDIDFHFCADSSEALELVCQIRPTLILQDLIMPSVDGLDLVRAYRRHPATCDIPVIVLSGKEDARVKADAFAAGANDYVVKLPDAVELVARIRYHSMGYIHKLQRDDAYRTLQESQQRLRDLNLRLLHISTHDSLTNIPNRFHFERVLGDEWRRAGREGTSLSVIMIDIDFFKQYNDKLGHQAGDQCLANVAEILRDTLRRPADMIARYGGEEFIALLPGVDAAGAAVIAEKMRADVKALGIPHPGAQAEHVTISLGVATTVPHNKGSPRPLIQSADRALYEAKAAGRDRVVSAARPGGDPQQ